MSIFWRSVLAIALCCAEGGCCVDAREKASRARMWADRELQVGMSLTGAKAVLLRHRFDEFYEDKVSGVDTNVWRVETMVARKGIGTCEVLIGAVLRATLHFDPNERLTAYELEGTYEGP